VSDYVVGCLLSMLFCSRSAFLNRCGCRFRPSSNRPARVRKLCVRAS
jgi:hypothetical protein